MLGGYTCGEILERVTAFFVVDIRKTARHASSTAQAPRTW